MLTISALHCYPIKSCAGHALTRAELTPRGIRYDREWMVVSDEGVFLSQRSHPAIALVRPVLSDNTLTVSAPGMPELTIDTPDEGTLVKVTVWDDRCDGVDQGEAAAQWFETYLRTPCRLVRMQSSFTRIVDQTYAPRPTDQVGFADGFPILLLSEASLEDLNTRLPAPILMNRFRPNMVVTGCTPFAEDEWKTIRINGLTLEVVKPCARCATTTVEQATGQKDTNQEPLRTLTTYRRYANLVLFGQNVTYAGTGVLAVGDGIKIVA